MARQAAGDQELRVRSSKVHDTLYLYKTPHQTHIRCSKPFIQHNPQKPTSSFTSLDSNVSETPLRFDGRIAIITGSSRGLGHEYALLLSRLSAAVVINSTIASTAESTVKEITNSGGKTVAHVGSIADRSVTNVMVKTAVDNLDRIDIIINNAGGADAVDFDQTYDSQL
ncbi:bifunctional hydroxyacyl-CoA dehydrogenase/enoyl-CoA hydratase fox2 [Fusarium torreyae]|uniref:Bifunctional hydroxyacyl-CoA dehydrogenase/enoyl-CoA hydratase fox2 n=1 Tax=Fusarium torreyae TaxID=1237075 RepID=A0A9W8S5B1_9HYPO|nr:bifunctional hydroxyacyl-CoA dehydrogenase/enoyl-CoA hydratase fox2 [Fusarium torreyae]